MTSMQFGQPGKPEDTMYDDNRRIERSNNAMWGWIAGAVAVLLVLIFVFAGGK